MSNARYLGFAFAVLVVAAAAPPAHAQQGYNPRSSASSPAYSPYLNLTRPGNLANNYFGLVRPQIDTQNSVNMLQQQYGALNQAVTNPTADQQLALPTTGHAATYMSYGRYYPGLAGAGRGIRPQTAGAAAASAAHR